MTTVPELPVLHPEVCVEMKLFLVCQLPFDVFHTSEVDTLLIKPIGITYAKTGELSFVFWYNYIIYNMFVVFS